MSGDSSQLLFLVAAAGIFYFLVIRPQQKRAKQQAAMLSAIEPGVEIVTIGGIFGTVVEVGEERLRIRVADGAELEIARRAVGSIVEAVENGDGDVVDDEIVEVDAPEQGAEPTEAKTLAE